MAFDYAMNIHCNLVPSLVIKNVYQTLGNNKLEVSHDENKVQIGRIWFSNR